MRLDRLPGRPHLTYCTNIHAGETWPEIGASLDAHVPRIKERVSPGAPLGIGLRLSAAAAATLVDPREIDGFRDQLERLGGYVFTINAFPYGPFHGTRVKERVYEPDWRTEERSAFTEATSGILAALLPEGGYGSISTVPGGFRTLRGDPAAVEAVAERLLSSVAGFVDLERRTGQTVALALEPEPWCLIETADEAVEFFERFLLGRETLERFALRARLPGPRAEAAVRRHLGICYDVCHGAVQFEEPVRALRTLRAAGIGVPKVQLSAALRVPDGGAGGRRDLERLDTGTYLHQVVAKGRRTERFRDLPEAFAALDAGGAEGGVARPLPRARIPRRPRRPRLDAGRSPLDAAGPAGRIPLAPPGSRDLHLGRASAAPDDGVQGRRHRSGTPIRAGRVER
ncbi:MAG: metabolite traffic protein EboE [Methylobacterium radiotolerans]